MIIFAIDSIRAGESCVGVGPVDEDGRTMRFACQQEMTGAAMDNDQLRTTYHEGGELKAIEDAPNSLFRIIRRR